jgi:hypothetical protein
MLTSGKLLAEEGVGDAMAAVCCPSGIRLPYIQGPGKFSFDLAVLPD